jgi:hypothetical protein
VRVTSPPLVYVGDISIITFEDSLQDVIGEHNEAYNIVLFNLGEYSNFGSIISLY